MENALLALSLLSCIALIVTVLLQRSEGGALGMGGGGGGGLVSGRGAADTLVRATMILAAIFFITSLALTRINYEHSKDNSDVTRTLEETGGSLLDDVLGETSSTEGSTTNPTDLISEALSEESDTIPTESELSDSSEDVSDGTDNTANPSTSSENQ